MTSFFNLYVGSETGLLKGIDLEKKTWCNINNIDQASRDLEIKLLKWDDESEKQFYISLKNQTVCSFNTDDAEVIQSYDFSSGDNNVIVGVGKYDQKFITCSNNGLLRTWGLNGDCECDLSIGPGVKVMKQHSKDRHLIATGGDENDLKIWDLKQQPYEITFKAKNVRSDWLELRVPINITNLEFMPESQKIVTSTGHHQVRVYDPMSSIRRPVMDMTWGEYPINALCTRPSGHQVFVGNTRGEMALLDVRKTGFEVVKYKGFAGSIRDIKCHQSLDVVAACGLDRFLRLYDINSKQLLEKYYLKSRLNTVLFSSRPYGKSQNSDAESGVATDYEQSMDDVDQLWNSIPVVQSKAKSSKTLQDNSKHTRNTDTVKNKAETQKRKGEDSDKPHKSKAKSIKKNNESNDFTEKKQHNTKNKRKKLKGKAHKTDIAN